MLKLAFVGLTTLSLATLSVSQAYALTILPMGSIATGTVNVVEVRDGRGGSRVLRRSGGGGNWNRNGGNRYSGNWNRNSGGNRYGGNWNRNSGGNRHGGNWNNHGGNHQHGGNHNGGHNGGWDNDWWWPGLAGVGVGFGLGLLNNVPYYNQPIYEADGSQHVAWCAQRYRSYDVRSNTFQPYDGPRRQCNSPYM